MSKNELAHYGSNEPLESVWFVWEDVAPEGSPDPRIRVKTASPHNVDFWNVMMRQPAARRASRNIRVATKEAPALRRIARKLYPKYIIEDWDPATVLDTQGQPVPFSEARATELMKRAQDFAIDELRAFCQEIRNFLEDDEGAEALDDEEVEDIAENSESASSGTSATSESEAP